MYKISLSQASCHVVDLATSTKVKFKRLSDRIFFFFLRSICLMENDENESERDDFSSPQGRYGFDRSREKFSKNQPEASKIYSGVKKPILIQDLFNLIGGAGPEKNVQVPKSKKKSRSKTKTKDEFIVSALRNRQRFRWSNKINSVCFRRGIRVFLSVSKFKFRYQTCLEFTFSLRGPKAFTPFSP